MTMQRTPCPVACDQTSTERARRADDAMSGRSCQAHRSATPASRLDCATKSSLRMSGYGHTWACCSMLCTHGPCLYSLKHPVSSGKETLTAWPAANRIAHLCSSEDTR